MSDEKRQPWTTLTFTMPTPGKGYNWNWERRQELIDQLALVEAFDGGTLTISYVSDALMPKGSNDG